MGIYKYYCENCHTEHETSVCPINGSRTIPLLELYWCEECNVPSYYEMCNECGTFGKNIGNDLSGKNGQIRNKQLIDDDFGAKMGTDLRPVFPEERLLIEIILGQPLKYIKSSVWSTAGGRYIIDGEKVNITIKELLCLDENKVIKEYQKYSEKNTYEYFDQYIDKFIKVNKFHFNEIDAKAKEYITNRINEYNDIPMFVSFSGGKDSTVTSDLLMRVKPNIMHIFGDTTLEFPETENYIKRFKKEHPTTPLIIAKNKDKNFEDLCTLIGPPSRVMRWCCTVFKTGAITKRVDSMFKNKNKIVSFQGIRRLESTSRSKYEQESSSPKITKQIVISPIIDWSDFDVWLYLLTRNIDFNDAYRLGYTRVGCWCCPNNSGWSMFLSKIHMNKQYNHFRNMLVDFARSIGKDDAEVYVDSGKWKARQGGNGVKYSSKSIVSFEPCALEDNAFNYALSKPISEQLYELFKPFGTVDFALGNKRLGEVYILDRNNTPILKLSGRIGSSNLKVTIIKPNALKVKNIKDAEGKIKCQLTKYQMCLNCTACPSICKFDAITISGSENDLIYRIDENKCVHCGECINHFSGGCYMRKVLATKRGK